MQLDTAISLCENAKILLPDGFWATMQKYVQMLTEHNDRAGLLSPREFEYIWDRHILDSLSVLFFDEMTCEMAVLDYGSGGGFPGIVLACACPKVKFLLAESLHKKSAFLTDAIKSLKIGNAVVFAGRVSEISEKFDRITIRAAGPLNRTLPDAIKHLKVFGKIALWAGPSFIADTGYWDRFCEKRGAELKILPYPEKWHSSGSLGIAFITLLP